MQLHEIIEKLDHLAKQASTEYSVELGESLISTFGEFMELYPAEFYKWYLETISRQNPIRKKAEALLCSGAVTENTTFAELHGILKAENEAA